MCTFEAMQGEGLLSNEEVNRFLQALKERTNIDFTGYSVASAARRLNRIRKEYGLYSYDTLLDKIGSQPLLRMDFIERFTVNVTEMFRDPSFFKQLILEVRRYANESLGPKPIQVWHPGCSSGEEILSLAIALHLHDCLDQFRFYGSDINEKVLERATRRLVRTRLLGEYEKAFTQSTGHTNLAQFFEPVNKEESRLQPTIPLDARFAVQNLTALSWPGKGPFDIIICRNVMIYFAPDLQNEVFSFLLSKLKTGGVLALGHKESIVFCREASRLETLHHDARIFRKVQ